MFKSLKLSDEKQSEIGNLSLNIPEHKETLILEYLSWLLKIQVLEDKEFYFRFRTPLLFVFILLWVGLIDCIF